MKTELVLGHTNRIETLAQLRDPGGGVTFESAPYLEIFWLLERSRKAAYIKPSNLVWYAGCSSYRSCHQIPEK